MTTTGRLFLLSKREREWKQSRTLEIQFLQLLGTSTSSAIHNRISWKWYIVLRNFAVTSSTCPLCTHRKVYKNKGYSLYKEVFIRLSRWYYSWFRITNTKQNKTKQMQQMPFCYRIVRPWWLSIKANEMRCIKNWLDENMMLKSKSDQSKIRVILCGRVGFQLFQINLFRCVLINWQNE